MRFDYVAEPWPADADDPQPEMRVALEHLGFRLLGALAAGDAAQRAVSRMAPAYGSRAGEFQHGALRPGQVFTAPDHTAFAQLAWLWDCRYASFTTVLADGRLLQTMTEWGADPVWPTALASHYVTTDRHTEQLLLATDRDTEVVPDIDEAWEVHRRRIAGASPLVPHHADLDDFVAIWTAESDARRGWATRTQIVAFLIAFGVVAVPFLIATVLLGTRPWWVDALVVGAAGLCVLLVLQRVWLRTRRWRGLRPAFRAPVPGART